MSRLLVLSLTAGWLFAAGKLPPPADRKIDFDKDVKPLMAEKCFSCHGGKVQQSGLRLDKRQNALRGGDYGPVIVQGKSAESKLILRVVSGDGGMQMPPTGALTPEEIGVLRAWIDQGAEFGTVEVKDEAPKKAVDSKVKALIAAIRRREDAQVAAALKKDPKLARATDSGESTPLHHAAGFGTLPAMKMLLDAGADVMAKNQRGSMPLHWAAHSLDKVRLLLARGADVNAKQIEGKTPLYLVASMEDRLSVAALLLDRGADPNIETAIGMTPLLAAAGRGDVEMMKLLASRKARLDAAAGTGTNPLLAAAGSKRPEAVRFLLERGADVHSTNKRLLSPLSVAAMYGDEASVKLLLERGAKVNLQDSRGYSPLMYAAYAETLPSGTVKAFLAAGADRGVTGEGETAMTLAAKRGDSDVARLLGVVSAKPAVMMPAKAETVLPAAAVEKALAVLARQSPKFIATGGCNSCHNQMLPSAAVALARQRGIPTPVTIAQLPRETREVSAERNMDLTVISVNSVGYEMFELGMSKAPRDEYTDAAARYLALMQCAAGRWVTTGNRPPLTADDIQTTAFSAFALREYAPAAEREDTAKRLARAAAWLERAQPATTQERALQLLGLMWANGRPEALASAAKALIATQRADGGWSQLASMHSDAYATGQALYALGAAAGVPVSDAAFRKGVDYLLRTQAADGSWHVKTRALPFQPYFDAGFPYGHDQWISAAGTSWASMALTLASAQEKVRQARVR